MTSAQVSLVVDVAAGSCYNVREDVCNYGHFFASREAAFQWQASHRQVVMLATGKLLEGSRFRDAAP